MCVPALLRPRCCAGYYGCQTLAHISSWRTALDAPGLPWIFVHLQPYTGSEAPALFDPALYEACGAINGDPLAELRHEQLNALQLPHVGFASAIDLGDPTSPYGNVHFQNKQTIARRVVSAALATAFGQPGGSGGALDYPPPQFLSQVPAAGAGCSMDVAFRKPSAVGSGRRAGGENFSLALGATPDPGLPTNGSSAVCPPAALALGNCSGFELLCVEVVNGSATGAPLWMDATATISADGKGLRLTAQAPSRVARGSRYAWAAWPLATLFASAATGGGSGRGLPILPWKQSLTCTNGKVPGAPC